MIDAVTLMEDDEDGHDDADEDNAEDESPSFSVPKFGWT